MYKITVFVSWRHAGLQKNLQFIEKILGNNTFGSTVITGSVLLILVMSYVSPHEWIETIKCLEIAALNPICCMGFQILFSRAKDIIGKNSLKLAYIFEAYISRQSKLLLQVSCAFFVTPVRVFITNNEHFIASHFL